MVFAVGVVCPNTLDAYPALTRSPCGGEVSRRAARSKYGAKPTVVDGIRFASMKEAKRYGELKLLEKAGEVRDLELQPKFALMAPDRCRQSHVIIGCYIADFLYRDMKSGERVVEDVKGVKTALYRWKKKHVEAQEDIQVREL